MKKILIPSYINNLYPILENEIGVTNVFYDYGDIRRYGGIGDGITDDSIAIKNAFANQRLYPEIVIKLEKYKTYICRQSLKIGKYSYLEGNNATILIDKVEGLLSNQIQFFWDNGYEGNIKLIDWSNLNIIFSPELITKTDGNTKMLWLFKIHDCEEFRFNYVNIISDGDERNHLNIFTFDGHGKIYMDNCYFKNTMRGREDGSILWIQSKIADGYYARINNCHFYSNTWDEIISVFCAGTHDVIFNGCTIEKYWYDTYYDTTQTLNQTFSGYFLTNIYFSTNVTFTEEEISKIYHNVTYRDCKLICKPINEETTIGILGMTAHENVHPTPSFVNFINCEIDISNLCQIATCGTKNNFQNNIEWVNNSNITFDNCNMKLSNFIGSRGILRSNSANLTIQNSKLQLEKYLYNQVWVESNVCDCYKLIMRNNHIFISNAVSILFKVNPLAKEQFLIIDNDFITTDDTGAYTTVELLKESTTEDGYTTDSVTFCHNENAKYNFYAYNNRINHQIIDLINSFKEE